MNMQSIMKQAQAMQKDIIKAKSEIDNEIFTATSSIVTVSVNGKKEVVSIDIKDEGKTIDDLSMISDMILIAINDALSKVDSETEKKLGKYSNMMPGLF